MRTRSFFEPLLILGYREEVFLLFPLGDPDDWRYKFDGEIWMLKEDGKK